MIDRDMFNWLQETTVKLSRGRVLIICNTMLILKKFPCMTDERKYARCNYVHIYEIIIATCGFVY